MNTNPNNPPPSGFGIPLFQWIVENILLLKRRLNGLAGGGSGDGTNIYNSDGTLAGARTVDTGGNSLTFVDGATSLITIDSVLLTEAALTIITDPTNLHTSINTIDNSASIFVTKDLTETTATLYVGTSFLQISSNGLGSDHLETVILNKQVLFLDGLNDQYTIGDAQDSNNGTKIIVDDNIGVVKIIHAIATPSMDIVGSGGILISDFARGICVDPAAPGPAASADIILPANPVDGQEILILFGGNISGPAQPVITTLTVSPNTSQNIVGSTPNSATTDTYLAFKWRADIATWYRID